MILSKVVMPTKFRVNDERGSSPNLLGGLQQTAWLQQFIGAKRPKTKPNIKPNYPD